MNTFTLFAWWGFNLWLPSYLKSDPAQGGAGLSGATTTGYLFVMQAGMWVGYVTLGFLSDTIGRKKAYVMYLLTAAVLLAVYVSVRNPTLLMLLGPCVAFAATGYFSGFGAVTAEIYPTAIRATAGLHLNIGGSPRSRPYLVGTLADTRVRPRCWSAPAPYARAFLDRSRNEGRGLRAEGEARGDEVRGRGARPRGECEREVRGVRHGLPS